MTFDDARKPTDTNGVSGLTLVFGFYENKENKEKKKEKKTKKKVSLLF
jgi:hypothetical protein